MADITDHDKRHRRNLSAIAKQIELIFRKAAEEAALIGVSLKAELPEDEIFSFDDYPQTRKRIKRLLASLYESTDVCIANGVRSAWTLSNNKNNALARRIFGADAGKLSKEQARRYFSNNEDALEAFLERKGRGLELSEMVWKYTGAFKHEIELGLDLGIRSGKSASAMARELQQYLKHPDKLFRRVREKHGVLRLSRAAAAFHPGRGVYRSSYRNACRLAVTETNIAYRTADHLRWQQLDFVVGIEIKLSGNHTIEGRDGKRIVLTDICDRLQGRYPKDFKFTGWHPNCKCVAVPILKTERELMEDTARILDGEEPEEGSVRTVSEVPSGFTDWVKANAKRIEGAKNQPYFIQDNRAEVEKALGREVAGYGADKSGKTESQSKGNGGFPQNTESKPPHIEDYKPFDNGRLMESLLHGDDELESNRKLGRILFDAMNETVYLLPNINPKGKDAHLRKEYLPEGVKEGKNPDFMCAGRFWDGKECSFRNTEKDWESLKKTLENHFKKAKSQADNFIIQVPEWLDEKIFSAITMNYLNISKKDRWIIICKENGSYKLFKNTTGQ